MKFRVFLALGILATPLLSAPALADDNDMSDARLQRLDEQARSRQIAVSRQDAVRIARQNGMVTVHEIDLDDSEWELEGRQSNGREIEIDISITDGSIRSIERD